MRMRSRPRPPRVPRHRAIAAGAFALSLAVGPAAAQQTQPAELAPAEGAAAGTEAEERWEPTAEELLAGEFVELPSGLKYRDLNVGSGNLVEEHGRVYIAYIGWLTDGTEIDRTEEEQAYEIAPVGGAPVIPGFNEGLLGMRGGGRRRLILPPALAFGAEGRPPLVPPDATVIFDVGVLEAKPPVVVPFPSFEQLAARTLDSGVKLADLAPGEGPAVALGDRARFHLTAWTADGTPLRTTRTVDEPMDIANIGGRPSFPGLTDGLLGMRAGGHRAVLVPATVVDASPIRPPSVPSGTGVVFDIAVLEVVEGRPPHEFPDLAALELQRSETGLQWADVVVGDGREVDATSTALLHYTGWLEDGARFDSSLDRAQTFAVPNVGSSAVIDGWKEGLIGMRAGGRRVLVIPSALGYGHVGRPPSIPGGATLVFLIDCEAVYRRGESIPGVDE